jgi:hypothetical protein
MIKLVRLACGLIVFFAFIAWNVPAASAQDPEPTITPTPNSVQGIPMSTGSTLLIEKSVTYGEIAVVAVILLLVAVELLRGMVEIPKNWTRR